MLTERGILWWMIPAVNDQHLVEVNKAVKWRGLPAQHHAADLAPEHGTLFSASTASAARG